MEKKAIEENGIAVTFTCPKCGSHELIEVMVHGQKVQKSIAQVTYYPSSGSAKLEYLAHVAMKETTFREKHFYCSKCRYGIRSEDSLAQWLRTKCPQVPAPKG